MVMIETSGKRATHCDQPHPGDTPTPVLPESVFFRGHPESPAGVQASRLCLFSPKVQRLGQDDMNRHEGHLRTIYG